MRKKGAEIITTLLERQGVEIVSGIPGGATLPLYDALRQSTIRHILVRHEQGAGFIAQGMARVTGKAGVCLSTSGPGATNLLTAIADAKLDSVPLVAITGQVPTAMIGTDAFQEVDTHGLTLPITKHNFLVGQASDLLDIIPSAFEIAESGRPGPVVIDVPKDIQTDEVEFDAWPQPSAPRRVNRPSCSPEEIARVAEMIHGSSRPVLYIGGGVIASGAENELRELARKNAIPVASTLAGLGAFPADDPLFLGMLGMHGARYTNMIIDEADLILAFGVRFDDRATGRAAAFGSRASIVHIDIDRSELDKIKKANLSIVSDIGEALRELLPRIQCDARVSWNKRVKDARAQYSFISTGIDDPFRPHTFIKQLATMLDSNTIITTDVGQHQMWVAQAYPFTKPRTLLTSGGLGTMGFGLPAAIGAALAKPDSRVVCISGDGSLLMNIQELATLAELDLDIKIIVMNNHHLGLVRQQQELFYGGRYYASRFGMKPDFIKIAAGFGIRGYDLSSTPYPTRTIEAAMSHKSPCLVNVPIHYAENVYPIVPPGSANHDMVESTTT
jgi:acetolactate synthase I/II/III large subunit